jgi:tetratricopeptide (TPR) repeat protein
MSMRTGGTVNKARFGLIVVIVLVCSGGCPENAGRLNSRARKAFMAGDQAESVNLFGRVLALDPDNMDAHFYLGWIYKMQGETDAGIAEFRKAIAIQPNHGGAYNHLGDLYLAKGMLDEARAAYKQGLTFGPAAANAHYKLGIAYGQKGASAEAADAFFDAGILAVVDSNQELALNAYRQLQESGQAAMAVELREILNHWFDPAGEVVTPPQAKRSPN